MFLLTKVYYAPPSGTPEKEKSITANVAGASGTAAYDLLLGKGLSSEEAWGVGMHAALVALSYWGTARGSGKPVKKALDESRRAADQSVAAYIAARANGVPAEDALQLVRSRYP